MFNLLNQPKTKGSIILVFVILISLVLVISVILLTINSKKSSQSANIEPPVYIQTDIKNNPNFKAYLETKIGQTTEKQIQSLPNRKDVKPLPDNTTEYSFPSSYSHLDNTAVTQNQLLIFKKVITALPNTPLPTISSYTDQYGRPDSEFTGSVNYGRFAKTYIYASKGFAIVGNPNTNEVYEIQTFLPTSVGEYVKRWGQDLKKYPEEPQGE